MRILLLLLLVIPQTLIAQKVETFYNRQWKKTEPLDASFYSINEKTDSGWFRKDYYVGNRKLQMAGLFEDSANTIKNGTFYFYHSNGNVSAMGRYLHGKKEGLYLHFYAEGMMQDSAVYEEGKVANIQLSWFRNGITSDSVIKKDDDLYAEVEWFDNGVLSSVGYRLNNKMHGKWKFYNKENKLSSVEEYDKGTLLNKVYFDNEGKVMTDTAGIDREAIFKSGTKDWIKYVSKNLYWPDQYHFSKGDHVVVEIQMEISETGEVENTEVAVPFHPALDNIALTVVRKSPKWKPAIRHNRAVKAYLIQPVVFAKEEE